MRYLSICSGIESASVACHDLEWEAAGFAEIDPFASAVLATRFPLVRNFGDFTKIKVKDVGPIDLLVGGPPCQSFSVAGQRGGLSDGRGNLALEFVRLLGEFKPEWFVFENVPGLLSSNRGRDFGAIIGAMDDLGYGICWRILDAQFYGVPQRRRRVFVVGNRRSAQRAAAVLFERESLSRHTSSRRKKGQDFTALSSTSANGSSQQRLTSYSPGSFGTYSEGIKALRAGSTPAGKDPIVVYPQTAEPFGAHSGGGRRNDLDHETYIPGVFGTLMSSGAGMDRPAGIGSETDFLVAFSCKSDAADVADKSPTLRSMNFDKSHLNDGGQVAIISFGAQVESPFLDEIALPVTGRNGDPGMIGTRHFVRRLTPLECERLQGLPDEHTLVMFKKKLAADSHRFRAIGNTMAVPCMRWIFDGIEIVRTFYP